MLRLVSIFVWGVKNGAVWGGVHRPGEGVGGQVWEMLFPQKWHWVCSRMPLRSLGHDPCLFLYFYPHLSDLWTGHFGGQRWMVFIKRLKLFHSCSSRGGNPSESLESWLSARAVLELSFFCWSFFGDLGVFSLLVLQIWHLWDDLL